MDALVNMIMGTSTTLDAYVIVRLVILCLSLELLVVAMAALGGMKGGRR